ncbi:MAG TPA: biotin-dependent carboxyltransferase family protein [Candidatus Limnocylindrales bacterium]|nr:biotin-dependent carboxyltransferase family protein [Candidatus Limnocylindrales bacterium]
MSEGAIVEILDGGILTTVQDGGRPGWGHLGVPLGGACDPWGLAVANLVLGNPPTAPALETTAGGLVVRLRSPTLLGIGGADLGAVVKWTGRRLTPGASYRLAEGDELVFQGPPAGARGVRAYLALPGGLDVPSVLGSASTCLAGGFGGVDGRPLRGGDVLGALADDPAAGMEHRVGAAPETAAEEPTEPAVVRILPGPDERAAAARAVLLAETWRVGVEADRMGIRLDGPTLPPAGPFDVPSHGVTWGTIQVPSDGRPIVLLADAQPTGGYPVAAIAISADRPILGQLRPGDAVRFVETGADGARDALLATDARLRAAADAIADAARWDALWREAGA